MDDYDFPPEPDNRWRCEECGHKTIRKHPKEYKAYICPKCKSEALMPIGWSKPS